MASRSKPVAGVNHSRRLALFLLLGGVILLATLILTDLWPLLRGPAPGTAEWYWPYLLRPAARWWPALISGGGLILLTGLWLSRPAGSQTALLWLAGFVLLHLALQLALMFADTADWTAEPLNRTLAVLNNGYFQPAAATSDMNALLADYPAAMPAFESEHARTHPPGLILQNWLLIRFFDRFPSLSERLAAVVWPQRCTDLWLLNQPPAVAAALAAAAFLPLLIGALAVLPAYALGRLLLEEKAARLAAALTGTIPALLLFAPSPDQIYATLGLVCLVGIARGSRLTSGRGLLWLGGSGLLLSWLSFLSLGTAALAIPLVFFLILPRLFGASGRLKRLLPELAAFGAGALLPWVAYWAIWGVAPWEIASVGLGQHYDLVTLQRNYGWWVIWNPLDLLVYLGLPAAAGYLYALPQAMRQPGRSLSALVLGGALLLVVLDLSGSARGEVGRLWLFVMPFLAVPAAGALLDRWPTWRVGLLFAAGQILLSLALGLAWQPVDDVIVIAQRPEMAPPPADLIENRVAFGQNVTLAGYALEQRAESFRLTLLWEAAGPAARPYTVFTHLLDLDQGGKLVSQDDGWPVAGLWPPTCWRSGEQIVDVHDIPRPAGLSPGRFSVKTGLYDPLDLNRLPTSSGETEIELVQFELR